MRCRRANVEVWRSGALEACYACRDVEEAEIWSSGALEMRCRRIDAEMLRYGDLERWRHAAGVGTWRSLRQELWSSSVLLLLQFLAFVPQGSVRKTLAVCVACSRESQASTRGAILGEGGPRNSEKPANDSDPA